MKRSRVLLAAVLAVAVLATSAILGACSGGGGGGTAAQQPTPKVQLSGTISGSYGYAKPSLSKSLSVPAGPLIDKVVAIPMSRGSLDAFQMTSRVTATIGADGKFDLALPKDKDWLLVLIQSPNTFVSSLAINAGSDSILNLPATVSTLNSFNLGTISGGPGGDALSSPTVTASNFGMNASQFTAFANSDDVFKNAKNIINNYNTTTGVWYQLRPDFTWDGDYDFIDGNFSGPTWAYQSYNFQMDTNATNLNIHNLCSVGSGTWSPVVVGWTPPSDVTDGLTTWGLSNPMTNSAATCTTYMSDGKWAIEASGDNTHPFYATDAYWGPYGTISYSMPVWLSGPIPAGDWTWSEGGVVKASFDPSVSTPVDGSGNALGYVPSIQLTTESGAGTAITAVDVQWWYFDQVLNAYTQVTTAEDYAVMSHFIERAEVIIESAVGATTRRHSSFGFDPTVASEGQLVLPASGADMWTYADTSCSSPLDSDAGSVGVFYSSGGIGRYFFARAPICP
jgi:hypothetical protein